MPKFNTRYNPAVSAGFTFKKPSMTQSQFKNEADINHLVNRYKNTGSFYDPLRPPSGQKRLPMWDDFASLPDFKDAQGIISDAAGRFAALPAHVRKFFDNDPTLLLAFIADPANRDKAVELGLIAPPPPPPEVPPGEQTINDNPVPGELKNGNV